jgi:hypothetical protein
MTEFQSSFNPRNIGHRAKMLGTLIALTTEIRTGEKFSSKGDILPHLKHIGWLPKSIRLKKKALVFLVDQAKTSFGYVPKGNVKIQYILAKQPKRQAKRKVAKAS